MRLCAASHARSMPVRTAAPKIGIAVPLTPTTMFNSSPAAAFAAVSAFSVNVPQSKS